MSVLDSVTIDGDTLDTIVSVRTATTEGDDTGEANIDVRQREGDNDSYGPGDEVIVNWSGAISWVGEVVGKPSESNGVLTYRAFGEALPLKHEQAYRVFYEQNSGDVVRDLVNQQAEQLSKTEIHSGDSPSDWDSIAPVAEPYGGSRAGLYEFGTDLLFIGCRNGHASELRTTYTDVGAREIADGFYELQTRIISPFIAEWSLVVELQTPSGTNYRWEPDLQSGAHTYSLAAEDAVPESSEGLSDGNLRYRFIPAGTVAENTGFLLDNAATIPFRTSARSTSLDASGVEDTERTITRRIDGSVGQTISALAAEDRADYWTESDSLYYVPGTSATDAARSITEGTTPVVSVEADRDFESVRNEILVQGADGVEAVARDQGSITAYGRRRNETIRDPSLVRDDEAQARAEGELGDRAGTDASITFGIADIDFAGVQAGQRLDVSWPRQDLDGSYSVEGVATRSNGIVSVTISATSV